MASRHGFPLPAKALFHFCEYIQVKDCNPSVDTLVVEDDQASLHALSSLLNQEGLQCRSADSIRGARRELEGGRPKAAFVDLSLPDGSGMELVSTLTELGVAHIIVITGNTSAATAVEAMKSGATDYLTKPMDGEVLRGLARMVCGPDPALIAPPPANWRSGMVGNSPELHSMLEQVECVAPTDATVLLLGDTGTGKEVVARAIHQASDRRKGPYLALNCGAVQASLIESELFGHEKGSFTGAGRTHRGVFERASGGTLFLDEVTEMPMELQVRLLRVLETQEFVRVGGSSALPVDARILAASNRKPEQAVQEGRLRADLYYRLCVFPIHIPPLRERAGDALVLAEHFLAHLCAEYGDHVVLAPQAMEVIRTYDWPGNVREVRNRLERAFILARKHGTIRADHLFETPLSSTSSTASSDVGRSIADVEKELILATMNHLHGDKPQAAETLGISLKTLYNRLHRYGLSRKKDWGFRAS